MAYKVTMCEAFVHLSDLCMNFYCGYFDIFKFSFSELVVENLLFYKYGKRRDVNLVPNVNSKLGE
jgi:hypothetical protein